MLPPLGSWLGEWFATANDTSDSVTPEIEGESEAEPSLLLGEVPSFAIDDEFETVRPVTTTFAGHEFGDLAGTSAGSFAMYAGALIPASSSATSLTPTPQTAGPFRNPTATAEPGAQATGLQSETQFVPEADGDGVAATTEFAAPNRGDGNADGVLDSLQANVASLQAATNGEFVTLESAGHSLRNVTAVDPASPSLALRANSPSLPYGLFDFEIHDVTPGGSATVRMILPDDAKPTGYLKYDIASGALDPFNFDGTTGAEIDGNVITLHFIDGGRGDQDGVANGVIVDPGGSGDDPVVQFEWLSYTWYEDDVVAVISVTRAGDLTGTSTVDYATSDGTATAPSDYAAASGTLEFAPDEELKTFEITLVNDGIEEGTETVTLTLSNAVGAVIGSQNPATLEIEDALNEPPPPGELFFEFSDYAVDEDEWQAAITVLRNWGAGQTITVDYSTSDGTATAGLDYVGVSGTLTFQPDDDQKTFYVPVYADMFTTEGDETLVLTLSNAVNATILEPNPVELVIVDAPPPTVQFESNTFSCKEHDGIATLVATLNAPTSATVTVDYQTADETAVAPEDYLSTEGTLTFQPGQTQATFEVDITLDADNEGPEAFETNLSNPSNANLGEPITATIWITDAQPFAGDDSFSIRHDRDLEIAAPGLMNNDGDPNGLPITAVLDGGPANGELTLNADGSFSYSPNLHYVGSDSFTYHVTNGMQNSNTATVEIEITNFAPVANDDSYGIRANEALTVEVDSGLLANDTDEDGDQLSVVDADLPDHGTLTWNANGSFSFTPENGFVGTDSFTYVISDGPASSQPATVTINVHATNNVPNGVTDSYGVEPDNVLDVPAKGVLENDYDPDGDLLTASLLTSTTNGTLNFSPDGSFRYTPNAGFTGSDSFTYSVSDGLVAFAPVPVFIRVFGVTSVVFLTTQESGGATTGDLTHDNPDGTGGTPAFLGGDRFFPDAASYATRGQSRNIVRVRAYMGLGAAVGEIVHFRSFDVDDPSTNATIDPNDSSLWGLNVPVGRDNRGGVSGAAFDQPAGAPVNSYRGRLRPILADGTPGNFSNNGWPASAPVRSVNGQLFAEVELAISFNPGDNFRVVASSNFDAVGKLDDENDVPTTGAVSGFAGAVSPQLSIWRRVHVERDRMATITPVLYSGHVTGIVTPAISTNGWRLVVQTNLGGIGAGELQGGNFWDAHGRRYIIIGNAASDSQGTQVHLYRPPAAGQPPPLGGYRDVPVGLMELYIGDWQKLAITAVNPGPAAGQMRVTVAKRLGIGNEYQGGYLTQGGLSYPVVLNTAGVATGDIVTVTVPAGVADPQIGDAYLFQDDFDAATNLLRVNPNNDLGLYDMMQNGTTVRRNNRFADAYVEPEYEALSQFSSGNVVSANHIRNQNDGLRDLIETGGYRGETPPAGDPEFETSVFWSVYVSTAFESDYERSADPPTRRGVPGAQTESDRKQITLVYLETIHDARLANPLFPETDLRARSAIHELAHQFGLAVTGNLHRELPRNIMTSNAFLPTDEEYHFFSAEIAAVRNRISSPGT